MYFNSALSFMAGWDKLVNSFTGELDEIRTALARISIDDSSHSYTIQHGDYDREKSVNPYSIRDISSKVINSLMQSGWTVGDKSQVHDAVNPTRRISHHYRKIDLFKNKVGVDFSFAKREFVDSLIFVTIPLLARLRCLDVAILLVPMASFAKELPVGITSFERICEHLDELSPLPLSTPLVIVGFSPSESDFNVREATSEVDQFLVQQIGLTLDECIELGEDIHWDFKEALPRNEVIAREVCAFANQRGGGVLLIGVSDSGEIVGVPAGGVLDDTRLRISQVIQNTCNPTPAWDLRLCKTNISGRSVLILVVYELKSKPCVTGDKVYIRSASSSRPARAEEIRRLVLADYEQSNET
jgi:hypothetical protein